MDAYSAPWHTWRDALTAKLAAGFPADELANELAEGERLLLRAARRVPGADGRQSARGGAGPAGPARRSAAADRARAGRRRAAHHGHPPTARAAHPRALPGIAGRAGAGAAGAWYEFFPRSDGRPRHGRPPGARHAAHRRRPACPASPRWASTSSTCRRSTRSARINRKGRNNTLDAGPDDVGSPWAIGSAEGGHDAIHPRLGTLDDFDAFVAEPRELGLEVALDLALQCAPDHPWVTEHPEWFTTAPTARSPTPRTRRRSTRTSTRSTSTTTPTGCCAEVAAGRAALDGAGRADLPGRQPAHQAG